MKDLVMKKRALLFVGVILFLVGMEVNASSIWFTNPVNGQTITDDSYSQNTIPLNLRYYWQITDNPISYYVKLFPSPYSTQSSQGSGEIDQWWYLPAGTYNWRIELWECNELGQCFKTAEQTITFYVKYSISVSNNFGGGAINIDGETKSSGSNTFKITGENLSVGAIDQTYGNDYYVWNQSGTNNSEWQRRAMGDLSFSSISGGTPRNYSYTVASNDNGASIRGMLRKNCNITFQNNFVGVGNNGNITVNSTQYTSPASGFTVVEQNAISSTANSQTINGINYYFDHWSDGSTSSSKTFYPGDHTTYTAYFIGYPTNVGKNFYNNPNNYGSPITLYWTDNVNTNVNQYQIWRNIKVDQARFY